MADIVDSRTRSRIMSGIRGKDTKPELAIRKALHARGLRYRLHDKRLPGKPDLVFPRYNAVIFVNGCFWHGHECPLFKWPGSRAGFWRQKIEKNKSNDIAAVYALKTLGWRVLTIWECALKGRTKKPLPEIVDMTVNWLEKNEPAKDIRGKHGPG